MRSEPTTTTTIAAPRALPGWAAPTLVFAAACLTYAINLDRLPHPDELYQILPAQGLLATGEPRLADGTYTRAYAQTWLIAQSLRLFGDSLEAARLSSLLGVAGTAALLFLWLRGAAGSAAAWLGAAGYGLSPLAVDTAQFARIYGVQTLAFTLACLVTYAALARPRPGRRRLLLLALAVPPLLLAVHLQPTTLFGLAGLGLWAAGALALPLLADPAVASGRKRAGLAAVAALGLLLLAAAWVSGALGQLWTDYRSVPIFNQQNRDEFWFYHAWYSLLYPSLWPLTGVLTLAALAAFPRPAGLALTVFAVGFLLNSFGASKALRYIAYAQPFLFALWGMGLAAVWRALAAYAARLAADLAAALPAFLGPARARSTARALVGGAILFLLLANPAWVRTVTLLADVPVPGEEPSPDWAAARPALEPWLERAPVVVTTEELGAQYYLGRFDVRFSPSKLLEIPEDQRREFAPDPRTGRPVVSTIESLALIFDCHPEGLFLLAARQWGREHLFNEAVRRLILERAEPVPLPRRTRVAAYAWKRPDEAPRPAACAGLPPLPGPAARTAGR